MTFVIKRRKKMGYFKLEAVDNKLRDINCCSNSLGIWGRPIKHHYLTDITDRELCQILGFDEYYSLTDSKGIEVEEVPCQVVATLAERFDFKDESHLYDYRLHYYNEGKPEGVNQQLPDEKMNEHLSRAGRLLRQGRKMDCFTLYEDLLVQYPDNFEILYRYGDACEYCSIGKTSGADYDKAAALFKRASSVATEDEKRTFERRLN